MYPDTLVFPNTSKVIQLYKYIDGTESTLFLQVTWFWDKYIQLIFFVIFQDGEPFLGSVDKLGTAFTDNVICTGYGAHIALPMLREAIDKKAKPTLAEAKALVEKSMEILFYRDARSYPKYQLGILDKDNGITIEGPIAVKESWEIATMIKSV